MIVTQFFFPRQNGLIARSEAYADIRISKRAGFEAEDYFQASQIAMGLLDGKLKADLEKEYLPEAGRRLGALVDDHGISRIDREFTEAEKQVRDELEGRETSQKETEDREEAVRSFQVVSGEMFTRVNEPVLRISRNGLGFSIGCIPKMSCSFAEILFNPVERMMVVRPCKEEDPNAVPWRQGYIAAAPAAHVLYDIMGWDTEYTYRIPCRTVHEPGGPGVVLSFDFDNFIGRAVNKKEEVIIARREAELAEEKREDAKSYFYPPEDDEEPQEIHDMEERFQKAREQNRKIFGEPVFRHEENLRGFEGTSGSGKWDMLAEAKPIDIDHRVDEEQVENLFLEIMDDPPTLPETTVMHEDASFPHGEIIDADADDGKDGDR